MGPNLNHGNKDVTWFQISPPLPPNKTERGFVMKSERHSIAEQRHAKNVRVVSPCSGKVIEVIARIGRFGSRTMYGVYGSRANFRSIAGGVGQCPQDCCIYRVKFMHNSQGKNGKYYRKERDSIWR